MKKTIATLLVICMMFSLVPADIMAPAFDGIFDAYEEVEAGTFGDSANINLVKDVAKGKAGGAVGIDDEQPYQALTYRVTLSRDPKTYLIEDTQVKDKFFEYFSYEYPPFSRGADAVEDTLYFMEWGYQYSTVMSWADVAIGTYSNNPNSGMLYYKGDSLEKLIVSNQITYTRPFTQYTNPFKDAVLEAKNAKTITNTTELANNMKWKEYANSMSLSQAKKMMAYVMNIKDGMKGRIKEVIDKDWDTPVANLTADQAFSVSAGYGGFLVALWKIANDQGATEVAASYEQAITDYFKNNDLKSKPVTVLIDTCMLYSIGNSNYGLTPSIELYEYVIAVDSDNSIQNGPEFITMNAGASTTREMITEMAKSSFERYPFAETKGWATGSNNSSEKKVLRLIDMPDGYTWTNSLRNTAIGWAIKVFQLKGTQSHIWMKSAGPQWANNNKLPGYMDHLGETYQGMSLDGFVALGNAISTPNLEVRYKVNDDSQATQDICDPIVTIDSPAHITMSVGMNADFLSFLENLKNVEGGGEVKIVSAVRRIEMKDDQVIETLESPFPAADGSLSGTGPTAEIQSAINWTGTIQDFIDRGVTTIDVFDDSIKGKTYEKLKEGNQTIRFQYDIDLKVYINEQVWEFEWTDIVERSGTVPLNTLNLNLQPLDQNMGCFTEDMEVIDIPGTYGTDTTQTEVLPSDKEDFAYYTRMMNRYEYTSSVGKSIAANKGEMVDRWEVTGVDDVAYGDVSAFAELKSNTPLHEEWEVMAGIPSTEEIYFSVGGAEYKVALIVQYWMNEHSRDRTYTIHFDGKKCEYNNEGEGTGDRLREWFPEAQPDPAIGGGHYNDVSIHCLNEPGTGAGDWQIQATWTYYSTNHVPIFHSCPYCGARIEDACNFAGATAEYQQDLAAAQKLAAELGGEIVYWTAASDGEYREKLWAPVVDPGSAPSDGTSPGNDGSDCDGGHSCTGHPVSCGTGCTTTQYNSVSPCTPGSVCPGHGWTITVTATIPPHAVCGPCCGHNMPDLYDTWRQGLVYDYAKISQIRLYLLDEGSVDGLEELTGTDRMIANVVSGNPTYFMNIAQMTEQDKQPYLPAGAPESLSGTAQGNTWYGSTAGFYNGIYGDWNRYEAQSSRAGRIRYVLDPAYDREESFDYSEQGDGSGGSFTITKAAVANPKQHDDVIVEMGPRSANCDGMSNHNEFGKSAGNNVIPDTAYGHADTHEWADGCLYTHIIDDSKTNFSNYHRLNSYGYSYVAQELKANDKNVVNYSELYNHHVQRDGLTNKASYSDSADDRDIATAEWKVFNAARRTKVIAVVISDFLIMQTSGGDQSIFYFEKAAKTAEAQEHFQKVKATEAEMFTDNPLSIFNGQACEEPCSEKDGSALIKSGIQGFEIVGGYNGRYDRPADKYKPYSPVTKEFLRFGGSDGGSWTQYNASYNRSNWTEKIGGTYSPHGNHKVYTIFDDDPAGTFNRPKRLATSQADSFKIYQDNIQILPTAPNQFYQPTNAMIWYSQVVSCFSPDNNALDMERMSTYVGARSNVNLGWLQRNKFGTAWMETWGTLVGLELNTKYYLTGDGDSNTDSINGVLVYTPVSVEDAIVLPQGDLSVNGFTISRDQRVDDWKYPNMNDVVNALKVCTLDPATCEYRYLDCKYLHETVLAEFDFSATYQGTEPDFSGDYEHNLKPVTKKNTYQDGGQWVTTNKITGVEYVLPAGYTIKSSGFGNGNYLSATGNTAWSIPFSDLGLSNTKSNRVKISMNVQANNTSKDTMIIGFKNVGFAITPAGVGQFIRPYGDKPDIIGSLKSYKNNMKTSMKVDLIFSFSNIVDCEAYINDVPATVNVVQDYRYDWQTTTNEKGFTTREKVLKYVTIPQKEWLSNPPENFATNDIMGTLNIGTWGNTNSTYTANFYLDNLTVTLMGGTTEHTSACYERTTIHTSTKIHVCDANCYLKEDLYTCDGAPNANYQLRPDFVSSQGTKTWTSATTFTLPGTGTYTIELYGEKGDSPSKTGGNGGHVKGTFTGTKGQTLKIEVAAGGGTSGRQGGNAPVVYLDGKLLAIAGGGGSGSSCSSGYNGYAAGQWQTASSAAINGSGYTGGSCSGCGAGGGAGYQPGQGSNDYNGHGYYAGGGTNYVGGLSSVSINKGKDSSNLGDSTKTTISVTLTYDLGPQGTPGLDYPNGDYTVPTVHKHDNVVKQLICTLPEGGTGQTTNYTTSGSHTVTLPAGRYKLEAWGAQGAGDYGGKGGYSTGTIVFNSPTTIYLGIGGRNATYSTTTATFNGGGAGRTAGGGATHIATAKGSTGALSELSSNTAAILLVAGGGGGGSGPNYTSGSSVGKGGAGGGANMNGVAGGDACGTPGGGGTTSAGGSAGSNCGAAGSFGKGGSSGICSSESGGGGGGGYYGGGGGGHDHANPAWDDSGGGGGSGYANTSKLTAISGTSGTWSGSGKVAITNLDHKHTDACYKTTTSSCPKMPAGTYVCTGIKNTITDFNTHKHTVECLTKFENADPVTFFYTGGVQTFKVPYTDNYKVEVYGPGANAKSGYASAVVKLNQGDLLYVYVGGTGGYHNYSSDIRFTPYTEIPAGIDSVEKNILEQNNAASDQTIMMKAGRTLNTVATYNLTGYGLGSVVKSLMGNSTHGRVIFTPLNQNPPKSPTILDQIIAGNIPEEEVHIYLGDTLAKTIIETAQVFKTYQNFTWNNYQGVTKDKNDVSFANNSIISNVQADNCYEFYIPVNISAKTLRQIRITFDNNTAATQMSVGINNKAAADEVIVPISGNTKNQTVTIDVSQKWWTKDITKIYFNTAAGTVNGTTAVKKIELIGHANVSQDVSGYGYTTLKTLSGFNSLTCFENLQNTTIGYNGSNLLVTATGSDPQTRWKTVGSIATGAVKAIKIVFKNNSGSASTGQLFYKDATGTFNETDSFHWPVGATTSTQTVWIDTVNHIAYNQTTGQFSTVKGSGWTGNITDMRFDWTTLSSGSVEVSEISFIGNGSASGTGGYQNTQTLVHSAGQSWTFNYTGAVQNLAVGKGTYTIEMYGAQGGKSAHGVRGGYGGYSKGDLTVGSAQTLYIYVGQMGTSSTGGWNGGGNGSTTNSDSAGGGGASDVRLGGTALSNRVIVAGGGGASGCNNTYGGDGGGSTAGAAIDPNTSYGGAGGPGTQSSGGAGGSNSGSGSLGQGGHTGTSQAWPGGGGGGGYYGGGAGGNTSGGGGAGGGGSGYIGGVSNGTTSTSTHTGNGVVTITAKTATYKGTIVESKVTITASTPTTKNLIAYYRNPLQNETARKTILDNFELIPDYVGGQYNPIWLCKFEKINFHDCKDCNTYIELECNEPHHKGLTYDQSGKLVLDNYGNPLCKEHYAGSNKICWSACCDDDKHKNTKDEVIVDVGGGTEVLKLAEYLQLDEGFTVYFPNIGDFYGNGALGLANPQITRGFGYKDRMDTTRWTREKRVKFPFDVIFEEIDGSMNIYPAHTWIELDVPTEYFNFYLLVENHEMSNASVEFECEAVNCGTTTGVKPKGGLSYNSMIDTAYTDALAKFLENYLNEWYKDILDEGYEIPHAKPKGNNNNEGVGKRIAFDSWGIMDFWKTKQENEAVVLRNVVNNIDKQIEIDFEGSFTDFMIDHTHRGMNEDLKPITSNDNKVRVNNALRSDSLRHLHGAYKHFYLDVIGRIGNFAIVDTEDFRFSNFFKVPIISQDDTEGLNDPNNWLVEGLILQVDDAIQNLYVGDTYDIRGNKAQVNTRWLDTYGTESWMTGTLTGSGRNINNPNLKSQILTGEVNNIEILKQEQLRYGYDIYTSIVTFGSYDDGQVQVVPKYYALKVTDRDLDNVPAKYNVPKGTYVPLDVYSNEDGSFQPVNIFNNAGNGNPNISNIPMFDYVFNLDWTEESNRRNYTLEEVARTNRVKEHYKSITYDLSGVQEGGDYNPEDLPILEILEYTIPEGRSNYLGTCQYILMGAEHRTFIGSPNSYDNNPGGDAIWSSRAGVSNFGVDKGAYPNAYDPDSVRAIEDIHFERAVQRWHGKLGLPSSSVFVPHGETLGEDTMEWIQGKNEDDWVIVCTAEMIAIGTIWNIHYSQPWFTQMKIYGETYSTGAHYPGHRVENGAGDSVPCSQCLPPIIAVFGKTSVEDVEIVQIY